MNPLATQRGVVVIQAVCVAINLVSTAINLWRGDVTWAAATATAAALCAAMVAWTVRNGAEADARIRAIESQIEVHAQVAARVATAPGTMGIGFADPDDEHPA